MEETNTQIAWPSKLKIGAKSKKGNLGGGVSSDSKVRLWNRCTLLLEK